MQINITHHNFELTEAITNYINEKLGQVEKHISLKEDEVMTLNVEVGKISAHHKHGNHFELKANLKYGTRSVHINSINEDLYKSIDESKDKLLDEVAHGGDKSRSLMKRFARRFKNIIKFGRDN
jgi:putative sigma-54 modulation protein